MVLHRTDRSAHLRFASCICLIVCPSGQEAGIDSERAQAMRKGQANLMTHESVCFVERCGKKGSKMFQGCVPSRRSHAIDSSDAVTALVIGTGFVAMRVLPELDKEQEDEAPETLVGARYCALSVQARPGSSQCEASVSQALT